MIFPTVTFAAFFAVVLPVSWALMPRPRLWKPFILLASYVFYGYADWRFCFLLAASTLLNQLAAVRIARGEDPRVRKRWLVAAVTVNLGLLGVFKYLDFLITSVADALDRVGLGAPLPLLQIALPVGISFFTFQAISYVVDVYRERAEAVPLLDFAVYEAFFPHLVAGPIVRAREFLPQLRTPRDRGAIPAVPALFLIAGGLFKKVVLADYLAVHLVDPVFDSPGAHSAGETIVAIYGYAAQIYCDFSAYTDMAIGLALLLGLRFPQNFDRPYAARSLQEFWRRWHMTLSRWLRDYLYIPLGGSRRGPRRTYVNLGLTMLLGGLWHGAAWTFVIWGGIHGGGLALERALRRRRARVGVPALVGAPGLRPEPYAGSDVLPEPTASRGVGLGSWLVTFHVVALAWVFFRAPDLSGAWAVLGRLVAWGPAPLLTPAVLAAVVAGLATQMVPAAAWRHLQARFAMLPLVAQAVLLGGFVVVVNGLVGEQGVAPFIYFRF